MEPPNGPQNRILPDFNFWSHLRTLVYSPRSLNENELKHATIKEKKNPKIFTEALSEEHNYVLAFMENILKMFCNLKYTRSIFKEMCLILLVVLTKHSLKSKN